MMCLQIIGLPFVDHPVVKGQLVIDAVNQRLLHVIRIILDRASSALDPALRLMLTQPLCRAGTCVPSDMERLEPKPSLTDILNDIQNLRRFCYRPRSVVEQQRGGCRTMENTSCNDLSADSTAAVGVSSGEFHINGHEFTVRVHLKKQVTRPE